MIPTLAIATASDAQLIMCALWDAGQALRRAGDVDNATRAYELATKAAEELRRIEAQAVTPPLPV